MPDLWNLNEPIIPPRSTLYHLEIAGINTSYVESLTGHITRLAESHSVYPGILMEREIASLMSRQCTGASIHKMYDRTSALNGTGIMASNLIQALSSLTGHNKLWLTTMLPWSEVLPPRGLLRSTRAWCPKCYEEQCIDGYKVYEPLLWTLSIVQICPIHYQLLHTICPHCQRSNPPLSWRSRTGCCSRCERWLGTLFPDSPYRSNNLPKTELQWLIWAANAVGELLAAASSLSIDVSRNKVVNSLNTCVNFFTEGNIAEFARLVHIPKNTVWLWCNGKNLPQLDALVRLCFRLKISVVDLLQGQVEITDEAVRALPSSCLQKKHRITIQLTEFEQAESQLEAVLLDHKLPPPSLQATAKALGYHKETLYQHFRDLCRAISAKYVRYRKVKHLASIEKCCKEVQQAVLELHAQGVYPSEVRVSQHLTQPGHLRYKKVRAVLQETQRVLMVTQENGIWDNC